MIIWIDVPVRIYHKCWHIHKIGKVVHHNFTKDYGDIPVIDVNTITNKAVPVVNNRGKAYAARKRLKYRSSKRYIRKNKANDRLGI